MSFFSKLLRKSHPPPPELSDPWRSVNWSGKDEILADLKDLNPDLKPLRILLHGPVGTGKSSFINSVQRALIGRNAISALESSSSTGETFTLSVRTHAMNKREGGCYPFVFCDIMGLEADNKGIQTEDIIKVLDGHILDGYKFNPLGPITPDNPKYRKCPRSHDKIHCLVSIVPADSISLMELNVIEKLRSVRMKASELNIPQVIIMTKVDKACELVSRNLEKLFHSRKIREKVEETSHKLGISMNNIYPVKNYDVEITEDVTVDVTLLMALKDIINFANDYAKENHPHPPPELSDPWRSVNWSGKEEILADLKDLNPDLKPLRILLHGPVGAGKSSFINSVQRVLLGRNVISALEGSSGVTCTIAIRTHKMKKRGGGCYPFVFREVMGLETDNKGIQTEDIIKVLDGHILDGYKFNLSEPITADNPKYKQVPNPCDKIHCLVSIVPTDAISMMESSVMDSSVCEKMKTVRKRASELNIPQVIVMTKVDKACELVHGDLRKLYYSRKIREKVQEKSNALSIPMNNIYPVKNYHEEITEDSNIDVAILMALRDIVYFASDYADSLSEDE